MARTLTPRMAQADPPKKGKIKKIRSGILISFISKKRDMAYKPLRMEEIRQILEFYSQGVPKKKIARLLGVSKNTVKKYIDLVEQNDINLQEESSVKLKEVLYDRNPKKEYYREQDLKKRLPIIITELGKVGVTRMLLWEEYLSDYPDGYSYSRFCRKLRSYRARQDVTIRLEHKAAQTLSVDFTGKKVSWIDKSTGEVHLCEVLVCTMPYSSYTFAYAVPSQKQEDFVHAINQALLYIGGLPQVLLSDNLKSFVTRADRYEPTFTDLCIQFSSYYGIELQATRVGKPKDKAQVERHVRLVYNKLYAPLRNTEFYSINEINDAFKQQLERLNKTSFQGRDYSRYELFTKDEVPHLKSLPSNLFEIKKATRGKVQRNYHVILGEDKHQYSVPYRYVGKTTDILYTSTEVEIFHGTERIAFHSRDWRKHAYSTLPIHMPEKHLKYLEQKGWDANYFKTQALKIGPNTHWAMTAILESKVFIEQTYNACLGLLRLSKTYSCERLENACGKARNTHRVNYTIIKNILKNNMDNAPKKQTPDLFSLPPHDNIRGPKNYS